MRQPLGETAPPQHRQDRAGCRKDKARCSEGEGHLLAVFDETETGAEGVVDGAELGPVGGAEITAPGLFSDVAQGVVVRRGTGTPATRSRGTSAPLGGPSAMVNTGSPSDFALVAPSIGWKRPAVLEPSDNRTMAARGRPGSLASTSSVAGGDRGLSLRDLTMASPIAVGPEGISGAIPCLTAVRSVVGWDSTWKRSENATIPTWNFGGS